MVGTLGVTSAEAHIHKEDDSHLVYIQFQGSPVGSGMREEARGSVEGRRANDFSGVGRELYSVDMLLEASDPKPGKDGHDVGKKEKVLKLRLLCSHLKPKKKLPMRLACKILEGKAPLPDICMLYLNVSAMGSLHNNRYFSASVSVMRSLSNIMSFFVKLLKSLGERRRVKSDQKEYA